LNQERSNLATTIVSIVRRNRTHVRLAVRMTAVALITYFVGDLLGLQQSQWAVLTSIIVMQVSIGASIEAMLDRFTGSLGGAVAGVIVSVGLHQSGVSEMALGNEIGREVRVKTAAKLGKVC
jgi:uncharacterized membrane protein YccC